jgi:hypothetical protein
MSNRRAVHRIARRHARQELELLRREAEEGNALFTEEEVNAAVADAIHYINDQRFQILKAEIADARTYTFALAAAINKVDREGRVRRNSYTNVMKAFSRWSERTDRVERRLQAIADKLTAISTALLLAADPPSDIERGFCADCEVRYGRMGHSCSGPRPYIGHFGTRLAWED